LLRLQATMLSATTGNIKIIRFICKLLALRSTSDFETPASKTGASKT
jgi:hypothetical protein